VPEEATADAARGARATARELTRHVLLPFALQRALLVLVGIALRSFLPDDRGFHTGLPRIVDMWVRWDAVHYMTVASEGYGGHADAFFPLYPAIAAAVGLVMPLPVAGLLVANVAALATLSLLYLSLVEREPEVAVRAVVVALLFPTSFFLSAPYAESTYLACAIGAFLAADRGRLKLAALCVLLACLSRPHGLLALSLPFALAWLVHSRQPRELPWFTLAAPVALLVLVLIHLRASGDPLGFLHGKTVQGMRVFWSAPRPSPPLTAVLLDEGIGPNLVRRLLNWSSLALVGAACVHLLRRRELAHAALCVLTLALPLYFHKSVFDAASMGRYALSCFPVFIVLARWTRRPGPAAMATDWGFAMLQVVFFSLFTAWVWAE